MKKPLILLFVLITLVCALAVPASAQLQPPNCTYTPGTGSIITTGNAAFGYGTQFTTEVHPGDRVMFFEGSALVKTVVSDTELLFTGPVDSNPDWMPYTVMECQQTIYLPIVIN